MEIMKKEMITSLELLEQINIFREREGKSVLRHDTLLGIVRDEFEEEISLQEILESTYINSRGREYPMYILTFSQAKQVLVRESKFVRKAVIKYIEELENELKKQQPASYQIEDPIERARAWADEQEAAKKQIAEATDGTNKIISLTALVEAWRIKYPHLRVGLTTTSVNNWLCHNDFIKHKSRNTFMLLDKGRELLLPDGYVLSKSHKEDCYTWGTKMTEFFDNHPELFASFERYVGKIHYEIQVAKWDREDEQIEMETVRHQQEMLSAYEAINGGRYRVCPVCNDSDTNYYL